MIATVVSLACIAVGTTLVFIWERQAAKEAREHRTKVIKHPMYLDEIEERIS